MQQTKRFLRAAQSSAIIERLYVERAAAWTKWFGYLAGLAAVAVMTVFIGLVQAYSHIANVSMLYLIAVLVTASAFGAGPAVFASFAAFLAFDWFFVEPFYTFTVGDPAEWVALLLFLLTAIITGQLAASQRRRTQEAERREREATVLYDVARLMNEPDLDQALRTVAERLRQELQVAAVAVEFAYDGGLAAARAAVGEPEALRFVHPLAMAPTRVLGEGPTPTITRRGAPGHWIRIVPPHPPGAARMAVGDRLNVVPVKAQDRKVGALLLVRRSGASNFSAADDRLLSAVAAHLGVAFERARLRREATEAEILRRADELKTALLNAVSHDLRNPLASIIASAGSLRQPGVTWTEQERQEFAEGIEQEAQRLNQIVGNLLDLSRMESGSLKPERGWYDLGALVDDVLGRLELATARHDLVVDIPEDLSPVSLDYVEIDQVLTNLIENAAKYTPAATEIRIAARRVNMEVQVEVADRGPGIPPAALPRLFVPFYRVYDEGIRGPRPRGTGIGLAVAKGLVEAHGGRIWAENRRGGGARFIFTLPLTAPGEAKSSTEKERA